MKIVAAKPDICLNCGWNKIMHNGTTKLNHPKRLVVFNGHSHNLADCPGFKGEMKKEEKT